jgi:hypothetical protein
MPSEKLGVWPIRLACRKQQAFPVETAILISVVEYFLDLVTDNEAMAVRFGMYAAICVWPNVGSIERGEYFASRNGTLSAIGFGHGYSKCALTQAWLYQSGGAVSS